MKKYLKRIIVAIIAIIVLFLGYTIYTKISHKNQIKENTKIIPSFSVKTMKDDIFSHSNLKENYQTIFVFFNTQCEFCQHEAEDIVKNHKEFNDTQWVFISIESSKIIQDFVKKKKLSTIANATFLSDEKGTLLTLFDVSTFPTTIVYNSNKEFVKKYKGQIKTTTIMKDLN